MCPALAGRFLTAEVSGKPSLFFFFLSIFPNFSAVSTLSGMERKYKTLLGIWVKDSRLPIT